MVGSPARYEEVKVYLRLVAMLMAAAASVTAASAGSSDRPFYPGCPKQTDIDKISTPMSKCVQSGGRVEIVAIISCVNAEKEWVTQKHWFCMSKDDTPMLLQK